MPRRPETMKNALCSNEFIHYYKVIFRGTFAFKKIARLEYISCCDLLAIPAIKPAIETNLDSSVTGLPTISMVISNRGIYDTFISDNSEESRPV